MNDTSNSSVILDTTFVVCDVETTGLSPYYTRITEIALIKIKEHQIVDSFTTLINPNQYIPTYITLLTGITNEDVMDKPAFEDIFEDIVNFFEYNNENPPIFVGHYASFDYRFLQESFGRLSPPFNFNIKSICTCKLARRILRELKSKSLSNVASHLGIKQIIKHRAYDDTLTTAKIFLRFLDILQKDFEFKTVDELIKYQNTRIYNVD